jgi:hypothetical protein
MSKKKGVKATSDTSSQKSDGKVTKPDKPVPVDPAKLHEPRHPTLLDSLVAPQYEKEEPNQFDQVYDKEITEQIEVDLDDTKLVGAQFDDINFSNGLMMIKFVEEAIQ